MAEFRLGDFVVSKEAGTVQFTGAKDVFLVSPEKFGEHAFEAVRLFIRAFQYGQIDIKRKLVELSDLSVKPL